MHHKDRPSQHSALSTQKPDIMHRYVRVYCCVFAYLLSTLIVLCRASLMFFLVCKLHPHWQSERGIVSKHAAQHRAISSAQVALDIIKSLVARNDVPLFSAPFIFRPILCASVAGGVGRRRSGALVHRTKQKLPRSRINATVTWDYTSVHTEVEITVGAGLTKPSSLL